MFSAWNNLSIKYKVLAIALVGVVGIGINLSHNYFTTIEINKRLNSIRNVQFPIIQHMDKVISYVDNISEYIALAPSDIDSLEDAEDYISLVHDEFDAINTRDSSEKDQLDELQSQLDAYFDAGSALAVDIDDGLFGIRDKIAREKSTQVRNLLKNFAGSLVAYRKANYEKYLANLDGANSASRKVVETGLYVALVATFVLILTALIIAYSLTAKIVTVGKSLSDLSQGRIDLDSRMEVKGNDEVGELVSTFNCFVEIFSENKRSSDEAFRVKNALANAASIMMLLDNDNKVIFCNKAMQNLLINYESQFITELDGFSIQDIDGCDLQALLGDRILTQLNNLDKVFRQSLVIAERAFGLTVSPVYNDLGLRLGVVAEWTDETEELHKAMEDIDRTEQEVLQTKIQREKERAIAAENERIRQALDNVATCALILDTLGAIIYVNEAAQEMMSLAELSIQSESPSFYADRLIGSQLDTIKAGLQSILSKTPSIELKIGDHTFKITANEIISDGKAIGTVVEWIDRTEEVAIETEIDNLVIAASKGDFSQRIDEKNKTGFFLALGSSLNSLVKTTYTGIDDVLHVLKSVAKGDLTQTIDAEYEGTFAELKDHANHTVNQLQIVISEINDLVGEANQGNFSTQIALEGKSGFFMELSDNLNKLMQMTNKGLNDVQDVIGSIAVGDLSRKISAQYHGTFAELKNDTNHTVQQLQVVISEIGGLVDQANQGNFSVQIDLKGKTGFFRELSENLNQLMHMTNSGLNEVKGVIGAIAVGDLSQSIEKNYAGTFADLKNDTNHTVRQLQTVISEIGDLVHAANQGDFSTQINLTGKSGFFKDLSESLNRLMQMTNSGLNDVQGVIAAIAIGDLTQTINAEYKGTFADLKNDTNHTVQQLQTVISEIGNLVNAANQGDFSTQIDLAGKSGFFKNLSQSLNTLMQMTHSGLNDVQDVIAAIAMGDLTQTIETHYSGTFGDLKNNTNHTVLQLQTVISEIGDLVNAANQGDFSTQIDLTGKSGFFKDLSESLNMLMQMTNSGLNDVQGVIAAIAIGDLTQTINTEYKGTFADLKNNTNHTVQQLQTVISEIGGLVNAANQGNFSTQIELMGKSGFFKDLSESLNMLMQMTNSGLNDVQGVIAAIAVGDLTQTVNAEYKGTFADLKNNTNHTVQQLQTVVSEIGGLVNAANQGNFSTQIDLTGKSGFFKGLSESLNMLMQMTNRGLNDVQGVIAAIAVGDLTQTVNAEYKGTFADLKNNTNHTVQELQTVISEIGGLVNAANQGNFSTQIDLTGKSGFFKDLSESLNMLMQMTNRGLNDVQGVIAAIAVGDLTQTINAEYKGTFADLKNNTNHTVQQLQTVISEIGGLVNAANQGNFSTHINLDGKTGFFKDLSQNLNSLMQMTDSGLNDVQDVIAAIAMGDLSKTIDAEYQGTFAALKNNSNHTVQQLQTLISEIGGLVNEANQGNFSTHIDLQGKTGFFKDLSESLNKLMLMTDSGLSDVQGVIGAIAIGDLSKTIDAEYQGTFAALKNNTNHTVHQLQGVINEINTLVSAANLGNFKTQIDLVGKSGFFLELSENLNQLMEMTNHGLLDVQDVIGSMASGDLTKSITNDYEGAFGQLKDDINSMVQQLTYTIVNIRETSTLITQGANKVADGSTDIRARTDSQATSLQETSASIMKMTEKIVASAHKAEEASNIASSAESYARSGGDVVDKAIQAMSDIKESSDKISEIIAVIDDISFQTNLLALNAAVEAARAGKQGRGFAVVAAEVRNLAQRSADSAKEIKDLIGDTVEKVEIGSTYVNESGSALSSILKVVVNVSEMMREIDDMAQEQRTGIEHVNTTISTINTITQQNSIIVDQTSAASDAMKEQASNMSEKMKFFRTK